MGLVLVLFETPSGFAIFNIDGVQLFLPKAEENIWANYVKDYMTHRVIWLKEFKTFKNKSNAFNHTGINSELAQMIKKWRLPGQLLAVGKQEHKTIIEQKLKISCLFNEAVMEVMWGIKHLMKSLVPQEKSELPMEERLLMSYGLKTLLNRHGFNVKPEMVFYVILKMKMDMMILKWYTTNLPNSFSVYHCWM
ncbi:hypothetical protein BDA96_04G009000 [Sorghum bicolor]|nr:hypothetical protein BDA96_04G009000 [Sorghum bicolor]